MDDDIGIALYRMLLIEGGDLMGFYDPKGKMNCMEQWMLMRKENKTVI
jgi:hypothetical protein